MRVLKQATELLHIMTVERMACIHVLLARIEDQPTHFACRWNTGKSRRTVSSEWKS
jgi:hypothetical protein